MNGALATHEIHDRGTGLPVVGDLICDNENNVLEIIEVGPTQMYDGGRPWAMAKCHKMTHKPPTIGTGDCEIEVLTDWSFYDEYEYEDGDYDYGDGEGGGG